MLDPKVTVEYYHDPNPERPTQVRLDQVKNNEKPKGKWPRSLRSGRLADAEAIMWAQSEIKLRAEPQLGERIMVRRGAELGLCMSSPGQLDKCFRMTANGVKYTVAFRRRGLRGNVATHVYTDDSKFQSLDGLRVGDIATVENSESIIAAPGFEIYAKVGNGWLPVVGFNGEVDVVHAGKPDEKRDAKMLAPTQQNPVRLRIRGFTMRRSPAGSQKFTPATPGTQPLGTRPPD